MRAVVTDLDRHALGGRAVRKQVTLYLNGSEQGPQTSVLLYLPAGAKAPAPLFVGLNFHGNQAVAADPAIRSEEHTSELQSLMRNSYAVFCLKKKHNKKK